MEEQLPAHQNFASYKFPSRIAPFPHIPLDSASSLRLYPSPSAVSARIRSPSSRRPSNLLKQIFSYFLKSSSKHHTLTVEERVSCLALYSIIVVFTAMIAHHFGAHREG